MCSTKNGMPQRETLSGTSKVVAEDPYELRVVVPGDGASWKVSAAKVDGQQAEVSWTQDGYAVRVKIEPRVTGELSWSISF